MLMLRSTIKRGRGISSLPGFMDVKDTMAPGRLASMGLLEALGQFWHLHQAC